MNIYFGDRRMDILGMGSTKRTSGFLIENDERIEEIDTGVSSFSFTIHYTKETRLHAKAMCAEGNYILRDYNDNQEMFVIIDTEDDNAEQAISVYAENGGLDLINDIADAFTSTTARNIAWYVNHFASTSGFVINKNEIPNLVRTLSWDGSSTVSERLRSVARQFDGAEIGYSFDIKGLKVIHKYIDIYKKRGKNVGQQLRMGKEVASIREKRSIANLVTALKVTGGTPDGGDKPINLIGYSYDDGDIYVNPTNGRLQSRSALEKWTRFLADLGETSNIDGHIVGEYSFETTDKATLCSHAVTELKKLMQPEVNYEVELHYLPRDLKLGDTINIIDDAGELYLSARVLKLTERVSINQHEATFGEFLIKESGISERLQQLAEDFANAEKYRTRYTWIAYADDIEGHGISLSPEGKAFIGLATNRMKEEVDISDPSIFTWMELGNVNKGVTLTITSSNGAVFIDTTVVTTLTAHVYMKEEELDDATIATLGVIKWYEIDNGVERFLATGKTYNITQADNIVAANIVAKLEG